MSATPYDLDELRRLEKEATPGSLQDADFYVALRNAAGAGMLERMAKLEDVAKAARHQSVYADDTEECAVCTMPVVFDGYYVCETRCIGRLLRAALDALTTKEPRDLGDQGRVDDCVKAFGGQFVKKGLR